MLAIGVCPHPTKIKKPVEKRVRCTELRRIPLTSGETRRFRGYYEFPVVGSAVCELQLYRPVEAQVDGQRLRRIVSVAIKLADYSVSSTRRICPNPAGAAPKFEK